MNARALSDAFASVVATAASGVVRVDGRRRFPSSGVRWSADLVVTAAHTLHRDTDLTVGLPDGRTVAATLVGRDAGTDLAVLRLDGAGEAGPAWSPVAPPAPGHLVFAVARPGPLRTSLSVVTGLDEDDPGDRAEWAIYTQLGPWPGFSGSACVDADGAFVGLNTVFGRRAVVVPAATVRRVVEALVAHGRVPRPYLGIGTHPVRIGATHAAAAGQPVGLLVHAVAPGQAAEAAGVMVGDVLLSVEGRALSRLDGLLAELDRVGPGGTLSLRVLRGGVGVDVPLTVGSR